MLTIAEIARRYGLPESTARFYCKRFLAFLPHAGQGKRRRFAPEALPVFEYILAAIKARSSTQAVEMELESRFPRILDVDSATPALSGTPPKQAKPELRNERLVEIMENQTEALRHIAGSLVRLVANQERIERLAGRLDRIEEMQVQVQQRLEQFAKCQNAVE